MIFPPDRDKEIVKSEFDEARKKYHTIEDEKEKRLFAYRVIKPLYDEYHRVTLDVFQTDTKGVCLSQVGIRYYVSIYERHVSPKGISSSIQGALFFGGTEDEESAKAAFERKKKEYESPT